MVELKSFLYRFNGHCDLSRDADFVLLFQDGSVLKTHALILSKASPVLAELLRSDTQGREGILPLESNNSLAWCVILNYLYPGVLHNDDSILTHELVIESVLEEAHRYGIKRIMSRVDVEVQKLFCEMQIRLETHLIDVPDAFHWMQKHKKLMIAVAKFELPKSLTAANNCLSSFLESVSHFKEALERRKTQRMKRKLEFKDLVLVLDKDHLDFADLIAVGYSDVLFKFHGGVLGDEP